MLASVLTTKATSQMGVSMPFLNLSSPATSTTTSPMAVSTVLSHTPYANSSSLLRSSPQPSPFSPTSFSSSLPFFKISSLSISRSNNRRSLSPVARASLSSVESEKTSGSEGEKKLLLKVNDLTAVIAESKQEILKGVNLTIYEGEIHAVMGKNGSGKSTFAKVLVGHPDYEVTGGSVVFKGENLLEMEPEERSLAGLFMSFQSPVEIPGVSNIDFLNMAYNTRRRKLGLPELGPIEFYAYIFPKLDLVNMKTDFLNRNVNEGFSGGEKKRNEILQLAVLGADLSILDEIDSGLDVDALRDVAKAVNVLLTPKNSVLIITHYLRLLEVIKPSYIHVMEDGKIVKTGDISIAKLLEKEGYKAISAA